MSRQSEDIRASYRRRIRRHVAICAIHSVLIIAIVAGVANVPAIANHRHYAIGALVTLVVTLVVATFVNLRCPRCGRFLDSRFLVSGRPDCPRCGSLLRG